MRHNRAIAVLFVQKDFAPEEVLHKPLIAHLSTVDEGAPRDSPVWFLWEEGSVWIFGQQADSFVQRLQHNPQCALGVVDFNLERGILLHVGVRGTTTPHPLDKSRLNRFLSKYLGAASHTWNPWFLEHIVRPLNVMFAIHPRTIVCKNASFFKTEATPKERVTDG